MKKEYLIYKLSEEMKEATRIDNELFPKFDVKRGLRNEDGTGVLVGLTKIGQHPSSCKAVKQEYHANRPMEPHLSVGRADCRIRR